MAGDDRPDNVLFRWYEQYIGEPERETDVYLGFGLFFLAVGFGILSLALFAAGVGIEGFRSDLYFQLAPYAYLLGMFSLPVLMLSIVTLLPVHRGGTIAAAFGVVIVGVAAAFFVQYYPDDWAEFGSVQTLQVIGIYSFGLFVVIASTGAALVAHHLERARAPAPSEIREREIEEPDEETETITEEQVEADIEQAMADVDITWGGVERSENRELTLNTDFADDAIQAGQIDVEAQTRVETGGVDQQVQGLKNMKGGDTKTATSEATVDDQTAALNELKKQKEADEVPDNAPTAQRGLFGRLLERVGLG